MSVDHVIRFIMSLVFVLLLVGVGLLTWLLSTLIGWWAGLLPLTIAFLWGATADVSKEKE